MSLYSQFKSDTNLEKAGKKKEANDVFETVTEQGHAHCALLAKSYTVAESFSDENHLISLLVNGDVIPLLL